MGPICGKIPSDKSFFLSKSFVSVQVRRRDLLRSVNELNLSDRFESNQIVLLRSFRLSGLSPFMGENDNDTYANINRVNYDFDDESFTEISDEAKDFIGKLLVKNKEFV